MLNPEDPTIEHERDAETVACFFADSPDVQSTPKKNGLQRQNL